MLVRAVLTLALMLPLALPSAATSVHEALASSGVVSGPIAPRYTTSSCAVPTPRLLDAACTAEGLPGSVDTSTLSLFVLEAAPDGPLVVDRGEPAPRDASLGRAVAESFLDAAEGALAGDWPR